MNKTDIKVKIFLSLSSLLLLLNILLLAVNFHNINNYNKETPDYKNPEIDYGDLSENESIIAGEIINELRPEYLSKIKEIHFMTNLSAISDMAGMPVLGFNKGGVIYVWYNDGNLKQVERTVCHEILHNIIQTEGEEFFVEDLDGFMSCYNPDWVFESKNHYIEKCEDCGVNFCSGINIYGRDGKCCKQVYSQEEYENSSLCGLTKYVLRYKFNNESFLGGGGPNESK